MITPACRKSLIVFAPAGEKIPPASRIIKAVLFHQSLPTLNAWRNAVLLTDAELAFALTLEDMTVLGPLMIADSDSWNLFNKERFPYLDELRANNAETCRKIGKR